MTFHWFLPTSGDGDEVGAATVAAGAARHVRRDRGLPGRGRPGRRDAGFTAVLPRWAPAAGSVDRLAAVAQHTERLGMLVAVRAGFALPTLIAQQAEAFQAVSGGRLSLNIVTGGDPAEQRAYGDFLGHDDRYARTGEFWRCSAAPGPAGGSTSRKALPGRRRRPGHPARRPAADLLRRRVTGRRDGAARQADVYLMWGEPPAAIAARVARIRALAAEQGRTLRSGPAAARHRPATSAEAWPRPTGCWPG